MNDSMSMRGPSPDYLVMSEETARALGVAIPPDTRPVHVRLWARVRSLVLALFRPSVAIKRALPDPEVPADALTFHGHPIVREDGSYVRSGDALLSDALIVRDDGSRERLADAQ